MRLVAKIMNSNTTNNNLAHFDKPLTVIVIGLDFMMLLINQIQTMVDVHTKKYSWEMHP